MKEPKTSYAQLGEDLIIEFIFDTLQIKPKNYFDIGAHDAKYLSNTYYFYLNGVRGVCVEPDPVLCSEIKKQRPKDKCLQVGISGNGKPSKATFYIMDPPTLNTFSKKEAEVYQIHYPWTKIVKEVSIGLVDINKVSKKYFKDGIDILSVDTEGMDLEIIKALDFTKYRPKILCVETAIYTGKHSLAKNEELIRLVMSHGYFVYADTYVNTIFVDKEFWKSNNGPELENFNAYSNL